MSEYILRLILRLRSLRDLRLRHERRERHLIDIIQFLSPYRSCLEHSCETAKSKDQTVWDPKTKNDRALAEKIGKTVRAHWAIENSLHWILDISCRDDDSRIRRGNAPENITIIKHMALNMLQKAKGKRDSIKQMRKAAGGDNTQLLRILAPISSI